MARHRRHGRHSDGGRGESASGGSGFDLSSLGNIATLLNTIDLNKVTSLLGSFNNNLSDNTTNSDGTRDTGSEQRRNELANALRTLINADKSELLQVALQVYAATRNNQSNIREDS
jgi:hypothetical protein